MGKTTHSDDGEGHGELTTAGESSSDLPVDHNHNAKKPMRKKVEAPETETAKAKSKKADINNSCNYCSLCWGADSEDQPLVKCKDCGVLYHNDCYRGVPLEEEDEEKEESASNSDNGNERKEEGEIAKQLQFLQDTCIACAAVGTIVKGRTQAGDTDDIKVETRPFECCLCSVDNPHLPLPLHPMYDRNNGRQLILQDSHRVDAPKRRLAWCHTLCANVIGVNEHTGGCVYACNSRGYYGGYEGDTDDRSTGSGILKEREEERQHRADDLQMEATTHFVIVLDELKDTWPAYTKAITNAKKFECSVCRKNDKLPFIHRMCVSCMCKEKQEPAKISKLHSKIDDECLTAFHVGCALWGQVVNGNQRFPPVRRVYYEYEYARNKNCMLLYCNKHAKKLKKRKLAGADWKRYPGVTGGGKEIDDQEIPDDVQCFPIVNAGTVVDSDFENDIDDDDDESLEDVKSLEGDESSEDDDDDDDESSEGDDKILEGDENSPSGAARKKKRKRKKKRNRQRDGSNAKGKSKGGKKRRKRDKHVETVHDRLEKRLNKKQKLSSSSAPSFPLGPSSAKGPGTNSNTRTGAQRQQSSISTSRRNVTKAQIEVSAKEKGVEDAEQSKKKKPAGKLKPPSLAALLKGKSVDWNAREPVNDKVTVKKDPSKAKGAASSKSIKCATENIEEISKLRSTTGNMLEQVQESDNFSCGSPPRDEKKEDFTKQSSQAIVLRGQSNDIEIESKRESIIAHMVHEVTLKRKFRSHDNDLPAVLGNVESHWKEELPRLGIQDGNSLLQTVRDEVGNSERPLASKEADEDDLWS